MSHGYITKADCRDPTPTPVQSRSIRSSCALPQGLSEGLMFGIIRAADL